MPKSQIIKDLAEDSVSLEKSLTRLLILAKDVKNSKLADWAESEIQGYTKEDDIPDYRKGRSTEFRYTGFNLNTQVTNVPLPLYALKEETKNLVSSIVIFDGIGHVQMLANSETSPQRDLTALAGEVSAASSGGIKCVSIVQFIPLAFLKKICSTVKNTMLTALLELEKKYGSLDNLGIDISGTRPIQIETNNADLNKAVFNINVPDSRAQKEPWYSKVAWNIVIPIIVGVVCVILGALASDYLGM